MPVEAAIASAPSEPKARQACKDAEIGVDAGHDESHQDDTKPEDEKKKPDEPAPEHNDNE